MDDLLTMEDRASSDAASDAQFFDQFDANATVTVSASASDSAPLLPANAATDADNLIDFEIFDMPQTAAEKAKPPEV